MESDLWSRDETGDRYVPVLQGDQELLELSGLQVPAHRVLDLELLSALVELPTDDVEVDGVDDEVLEVANCRHFEDLEELRVWEDLDRVYREG